MRAELNFVAFMQESLFFYVLLREVARPYVYLLFLLGNLSSVSVFWLIDIGMKELILIILHYFKVFQYAR